jgi:hypothetical protein
MWEAKIKRIVIAGQTGPKVFEIPISMENKAKRAGGVAKAVGYLSGKLEAPNSNPILPKKKNS